MLQPSKDLDRARVFAELCRLNYFYKKKTVHTGKVILTTTLVFITLVLATFSSYVFLLGIPFLAVKLAALTERDHPIFVPRVWNVLHSKGAVERVGPNTFETCFAVRNKAFFIYMPSLLPIGHQSARKLLFFRARFDAHNVLSMEALNKNLEIA